MLGVECQELKPCQREVATEDIKKIQIKERTAICQGTDGLSSTQNGLGAAKR